MHQDCGDLMNRVRSRLARLRTYVSCDDDECKQKQSYGRSKSCQESNGSETESCSKASVNEDDSDEECKLALTFQTVFPEDRISEGDINLSTEGLLEKLGHRLKERSDKVHKVNKRTKSCV